MTETGVWPISFLLLLMLYNCIKFLLLLYDYVYSIAFMNFVVTYDLVSSNYPKFFHSNQNFGLVNSHILSVAYLFLFKAINV
jgi:hypothetical protein